MRHHGWLVALLCAAWIAAECAQVATGHAGADPAKWLLHRTGVAGIVLLLATLAISTLRRWLQGRPSLRWRRPLGLAAFAFALLHVVVYATIYQGLSWPDIADDLVKRPYLWIGFAAFMLLLPMAMTSTNRMRQRLGPVAWRRVHRALYVIVPLVILHQGMAQKADLLQTLIFSAIAACFLIERLRNFAQQAVPK